MLAVTRSGASCANRFDNPPDESQFFAMLDEICREIDGDITSASCFAFTGRAGLCLFVCIVLDESILKRSDGLGTVITIIWAF